MDDQRVDWLDGLAQRLIDCASRRAPDSLSERLAEEWRADCADREGRWSRLRFAVGCCWATGVIARDRGLAIVPAAAIADSRGPWVGAFSGGPPWWRRSPILVLIVGLHVGVFYALAVGLSPPLVKLMSHPLETRVIEPVQHREVTQAEPPQIDRTLLEKPRQPELPPVESTLDDVSPEVREAPVGPTSAPQRVETTARPAAATRVVGGAGAGFPSADEFYPSASIHLGETGVAAVNVCVDGKGRLTAEPSILESSGSLRLDGGALRLAKAGSGHYRATTLDGRPVDSCYPLRIRFDLRR